MYVNTMYNLVPSVASLDLRQRGPIATRWMPQIPAILGRKLPLTARL